MCGYKADWVTPVIWEQKEDSRRALVGMETPRASGKRMEWLLCARGSKDRVLVRGNTETFIFPLSAVDGGTSSQLPTQLLSRAEQCLADGAAAVVVIVSVPLPTYQTAS